MTDKGKRVLEGPSEVEEKSFSKLGEQTTVSFGRVIVDTKLGISDKVNKEDGTELVQRKIKAIFEGTSVVATSPNKRQSSKVSEYIFQVSQAEREYFNMIRRARNIFNNNLSRGGVMTRRDNQKFGKGFKSKGWKVDTVWDIGKGI